MAAPVAKATKPFQAAVRSHRSHGGRLRSMSRAIGSTGCRSRANARASPISTAVETNDSWAPAESTSAGRITSTTRAATASALIAGERRPPAAARHDNQTRSVARSTGVSARTSSM